MSDYDNELVDARHPWLGLASFSESTQGFFYGREEEVAELARRVQRKLLTVLFGQSGLGKTSILRAGLAPRLRQQGFCPVYVRIDYSADAPPPALQIKQAMLKETAAAGQWSKPGADDEPLWEFLHRRDNVLRDAHGVALVPLLIFDQFEEIFTLAQADDGGRQRAADFLDTLAGLVENRPSPALEQRIDEDDDTAAQFDFSRSDYRVLITLREDYLAHLEGVKGSMPSITQNRQRLAPMAGSQALAAVTGPGGTLVTAEVAEAIVRFVAGGAELANAQVEPSLLSLICRELNDKRIAAGRNAITIDLLAGSHASILTDFYERALADQPEAVRAVIEDTLLTDSGYRENVAEERVKRALATAGASSGALAALVDRRLLRIEERLDVRRVELTHDVLCGVVKDSRERRLEREQLAEAERSLALQRTREQESRRALKRARKVAAACAVLSVCAVGSAVFGYVNMRRAEHLRIAADRSRAGAENLVGYLLDDFYETLRPVGRLDLMGELSRRTAGYYEDLDPEMRGTDSALNQARALARLASVQLSLGKGPEARALADRALAGFASLARLDPGSETTARAYADALRERAQMAFSNDDRQAARSFVDRARVVVAPFVRDARPSAAARRTYAEIFTLSGYMHLRMDESAAAESDLQLARSTLDGMTDIRSSADRADASGWLQELLIRAERYAEADTIGADAIAHAERVLQQVPAHRAAQKVVQLVHFDRAVAEMHQRQPGRAAAMLDTIIEQGRLRLQVEPDSVQVEDNQAIHMAFRAMAAFQLGQLQDARVRLDEMWTIYKRRATTSYQVGNLFHFSLMDLEMSAQSARQDDLALAARRTREYAKIKERVANAGWQWYSLTAASSILSALSVAGDQQATPAAAAELVRRAEAYRNEAILKKSSPGDIQSTANLLAELLGVQAAIANAGGAFAVAESASRRALELTHDKSIGGPLIVGDERTRMEYAYALMKVGKPQEARVQIDKAIFIQRGELNAGSDDQMLRIELARALSVAAQVTPTNRAADLKEARTLLDGLPPAVQALQSARLAREQVDAALR